MTPENEALIAEGEHVRDWMKRQDLKFSWQTVDKLIAALRAADERERELAEIVRNGIDPFDVPDKVSAVHARLWSEHNNQALGGES
jgi:hypothetical protein